ncbi:hypothetical protein AXX12_03355 [Anaerosporomusa subterranea]|uniref:Uncharacterized protein n=1 Tax=Anaerosporomusa subterranea TaxID=1794912 RepID=A0A154BT49_ANASB|nr:hypothetical protein AXX12_03355 [Anaerosporomusa subterranea]
MRFIKSILFIFVLISLLPLYLIFLVFSLFVAFEPPAIPQNDSAGGEMLYLAIKAPYRFVKELYKNVVQ